MNSSSAAALTAHVNTPAWARRCPIKSNRDSLHVLSSHAKGLRREFSGVSHINRPAKDDVLFYGRADYERLLRYVPDWP